MQIEYQVTFTCGTRVGTRSMRTVVVNAPDRETAIRRAKERFPHEFGEAIGRYRVTQTWCEEHGREAE